LEIFNKIIIIKLIYIYRLHLEHNEWGLSYIKEGKLDMRYDKENSKATAADLVIKSL